MQVVSKDGGKLFLQETMIPKTLQNKSLRFCKVRSKTKKPYEKDWTNKPYKWEEIENTSDTNYGVLCGHGDLAVIDCDEPELQLAVETILPETYRVKTGGGGTHNYFFIKGLKQKLILETDNGKHLGEVQSYGTQVVGPNSIHPNGKKYEEVDQGTINTLNHDELLEFIKPFVKIKETEEIAEEELKKYKGIDALRIEKIWGTKRLSFRNGEYYGEHPIHGSEGGSNFWINPSKNSWHCFRCNSGGGPLSAIAVKEKIIDCGESKKGSLRGKDAYDAIQMAQEKYGLVKETLSEDEKSERPDENPIEILWDEDLETYEEEDKEWIIEKLIPTRSVCVLTGKRGTMKTFITMLMSYSVAAGLPFLDHFKTRQGGVIYLDKENGVPILRGRKRMIKKGLGLSDTLPIGYICFSTLKIDKNTDLWKIEEKIEEHNPALLIIDTYRRGITFDENDAGAVSKLFVDALRPLVEKHNISIILIHHNRKSSQGESRDEMDEIRGSSDLANYADIILKTERKAGNLVLKQLKNRNAREEPPIEVGVEFNEEEGFLKMTYGGEFKHSTKSEKCVEIICLWITEKKLHSFTTHEAQQECDKLNFKVGTFKNALVDMQNANLIKKTMKGVYEVNQQKFIVDRAE